jgi:hypothetical protein
MNYYDLAPKQKADYELLDDASRAHPLEVKDGVLRFVSNRAVRYAVDRIDLNDMAKEANRNEWPLEDLMTFYRMMGYSLCGFLDIFGERLEARLSAGKDKARKRKP